MCNVTYLKWIEAYHKVGKEMFKIDLLLSYFIESTALSWAVVAHTFNPNSTPEAEASGSL